jgi:hypothetical protein
MCDDGASVESRYVIMETAPINVPSRVIGMCL